MDNTVIPKPLRRAIQAIEDRGILLVYPIRNLPEPASLWSALHPRTEMRWEWDESGDDRVANLWHLRAALSGSGRVIYAKWYQGRATFFSKDAFVATLAALRSPHAGAGSLSPAAREIDALLRENSPLSVKEIKLATELRGKLLESTYEKAMKELWARLWIVGFGEVEDGAFPSLAVGASRLLFEDLWEEAGKRAPRGSLEWLQKKLGPGSLFLRFLIKSAKRLTTLRKCGSPEWHESWPMACSFYKG